MLQPPFSSEYESKEDEEEEKIKYEEGRKNINSISSNTEEEEEESRNEKRKEEEKGKEKNSYAPSDYDFSNYQNIKDKTIYMPKKEDLYPSEQANLDNNNQKRKLNLMVMVIPKTNKDLPLPLNTLYFFLELFSYENELKQLTDEDNKLVFYLMNISWLNELKVYYNYKCIEFIIKKELKENKNFLNKINELLSVYN